jgi:exonuclease III
MEYMNVAILALQDLKVRDTDFSNGKYGKMLLRNVSLSGKVEFSGTTIVEKSLERVTDTSTGTAPTILN